MKIFILFCIIFSITTASYSSINLFNPPVTLGTPNGLDLAGQVLSLDIATPSSAGALSAIDKSKVDDMNLGNQIEFLNTDVRFFGELGVPSSTGNGWIDTATGSTLISIVNQDVFGTFQDVVKHDDNVTNGSTTSQITLTAQNWSDINAFGASYSGISRLDTVNGANGFFSGLQDDVPDKRYGITFSNSGGKLRLNAADGADPFDVIMDGTSGNPTVNFDVWFRWEVVVPAGLGLADVYVNGKLLSEQLLFVTNSGGAGTSVRISSGSTGGTARVTYHANFGSTIYQDSSTKTLLNSDFVGFNRLDISIPPGKRDYTIQLDAGIAGMEIGEEIKVTAQNINGVVSFVDLSATGNFLLNGLNSFSRNILKPTSITAVNIVDGKNSYFIPFESFRENIFDEFLFQDNLTNKLLIGTDTLDGSGSRLQVEGGLSVDTGNIINADFIKLGSDAPIIKMKKLTGTTGATEGANVTVAHGLTLSKIIGFDVLVTADNGNLIPMSFVSVVEFEFDAFITSTNVSVNLSATNSANLLSNAFTVLLTYEE